MKWDHAQRAASLPHTATESPAPVNTGWRRPLPSLGDILSAVSYNPETGVFTRNSSGHVITSKNTSGYVVVKISGAPFMAHRLAWALINGAPPESDIDHINGCRSDNRAENLRLATPSENAAVRSARGASGYKGVSKCRGLWLMAARKSGRKISGYFRCPTVAAIAYDRAALDLHGPFATLNFPLKGNA